MAVACLQARASARIGRAMAWIAIALIAARPDLTGLHAGSALLSGAMVGLIAMSWAKPRPLAVLTGRAP
jgi:hypothetical protein